MFLLCILYYICEILIRSFFFYVANFTLILIYLYGLSFSCPMNGAVLCQAQLPVPWSGLCRALVLFWMHWPAVCESREGGGAHRGRGAHGAMPPPFRIAVLGAQGVGKTAIVQRFLHDDYSDVASSIRTRRVHLSAAVLNGHVHDLQITDYPAISSFPGSSFQVLKH